MVKKQHIINYENIIIKTYKFRKEYNECIWNGYGLDDIPIIIKLINNKSSINIGNIFKYEEITTDFILHIGVWDINEHSNKIYKNITLYIKKDKWNELFNFDNIKEKNIFDCNCYIKYENIDKFIEYFEKTELKKYQNIDIIKKLDKYYTKPKIVEKCLSDLNEKFKINEFDVIIEPSAGCGNFIMELRKEYVKNINKIKAYDIFPENKNIIKEDFLKLENNNIIENINEKNILVVGGPPFSNGLSVKFFNKSAEIANVIAFVMPRSFKKQSMVIKLDKRFHLENTIDLDEKSFTFGDKTVNKACIFQIWVKKDKNRPIPNKEIPNSNYYFIDKIKNNEKNFEKYKDNIISIERVCSKAGSCRKYKNYNDESKESRLFIVLKDNNIITNMIEYLNKIKWEYNNIGPKSISKYELIKYINLYYETQIYIN